MSINIYADASYDHDTQKIKGAYYIPRTFEHDSYDLISNFDQSDNHIAEALNILHICELYNGKDIIIYNDNMDICNRINNKNIRTKNSKSLYRLCDKIKGKKVKVIWMSENDVNMKIVDKLTKN